MLYALILAAATAVQVPARKDAIPPEVTCVRVVEGDDGKRVSVRLVGVDTPETKHPTKGVQPYGPEASAFTKKSLVGRKVRLVRDSAAGDADRYGRRLAYVFIGDECFNETLIREGYGRAYLEYGFEPATRTRFLIVQKSAKAAKVGLWAAPD